jgi:hypothetical protein
MKKKFAAIAVAVAFSAGIASAQITLQAFLYGSNEVPANASTATGFGTVILNAAQTQITVDESWTGLVGGNATVSHIHTGPAGVIGPVTFPFSGVPSATSGSIPEQTFSITAAQVATLLSGGMYMNVHDGTFGGGEIRGQLTVVPEPSTLALLGLSGIGGLLFWMRRRTNRVKA